MVCIVLREPHDGGSPTHAVVLCGFDAPDSAGAAVVQLGRPVPASNADVIVVSRDTADQDILDLLSEGYTVRLKSLPPREES